MFLKLLDLFYIYERSSTEPFPFLIQNGMTSCDFLLMARNLFYIIKVLRHCTQPQFIAFHFLYFSHTTCFGLFTGHLQE
jgi:hypothetical protein